ncbi:MAG: outer membrane protein assembly factor BamA, partial [Bacteroidota bacterium]|nr:outer membrane protein assembly factor BamA [Bacteroidota bacterium]
MLLNPHLNRLVTLIFLLNAFAVYSVKAQAQAQDETYTIAGISVEGNKFSDAETIIVLSGLKPGDQITLPADNKL